MKRIVISCFIVMCSIGAISMIGRPVLAVDLNRQACQGVENSSVCRDPATGQTENPLFGPNGVLTRAIQILSTVLGVIAVIVLVISGIRFATSQGDPQKVSSVRNTIIYAMIGIVVAVLAQALVQLVLTRLPD